MPQVPPLAAMGERIVIMGPSNAGKSTLCVALAQKLGATPVHLDQLRHLPGTDWQLRPDAQFHQLHDEAIRGERWVMDGNYSVLLPQRLQRATGVIILDDHFIRRHLRYLRRTLLQTRRAGSLEGNRDSVKWAMIRWIWKTRRSTDRLNLLAAETDLPVVFCRSLDEVKALYCAWAL